MSSEEEIAAALAAYLLIKRRQRRRKRRSVWVKRWVQRRETLNVVDNLLEELKNEDETMFKNFLRMSGDDFEYILEKIRHRIEKKDTNMRKAIPARERLALTLRFLATGDSYHSLMYLFRIPRCTIGKIIPEVCEAIFDVLKDEYLKVPTTQEEWLDISAEFENTWNFPNCIGALDGKHVNIKAPKNCGSLYYNYKGVHSVVLMALVDAKYKFTYINVGAKGRVSDGGVFNNTPLARALETGTLNVPNPRELPGRNLKVPHVIVSDDAFALKPYIMKPFAFRNQSAEERIFNYRLSRARRIVENAFGIASARFRVLRKILELSPATTNSIVSAVCVLHNFLMTRSERIYAPQGSFDTDNLESGTIIPGSWRTDNPGLPSVSEPIQRNVTNDAKAVRQEFKEYFGREGQVPWQYRFI